MDELAQHAQADPLEFRLRHLSDPRAVRVIEAAAGLADWAGAQRAGRSLGIGYAQFKNSGAYCAVVAEVSAEDDVRLVHMWAAVDAGLAIVPDSVRAQVEGGMLQAASWMLHEALSTEGPRVVAETWSDYPVLGFAEVPLIEVQVIPDAAHPSLGVGEVSLGPAAGAIGNAVAAALGLHLRNLPLTRDRIRAALLAM
jgi:CO/xanthine dehydrogenase Mo-binding subunit